MAPSTSIVTSFGKFMRIFHKKPHFFCISLYVFHIVFFFIQSYNSLGYKMGWMYFLKEVKT